jgi:hypothetical protein
MRVTQAGLTSCTYDAQPRTFSLTSAAAVVRVQVQTEAACSWSVQSQAAWLTVSAGSSGAGPGAVEIQVAANNAAARSGTVVVAGVPVTISQSAAATPSCTYTVQPASLSFGSAGGTAALDVQTQAGCAWTAASGASWLTVRSGAPDTGAGRIEVVAEPNTTGAARSTTLVVAGVSIAVTQAAAAQPCTFAVQPQSFAIGPLGETVSISVSSAAGCAWTASTSTPWLTVVSGQTGSANGTVSINAAANTTAVARSGTALVAGQTVTFTQAAGDVRSFSGTVSNLSGDCPTVRFTVNGVPVVTNAQTSYTGGSCNALDNGDNVQGEGLWQNGQITASIVRRS